MSSNHDDSAGEPDHISKQEAVERVKQADFGVLVLGRMEPVPVLGEVEEHRVEPVVKMVRFGEEELDAEYE